MKLLVIGALAVIGSGYTVTRLQDSDKPVDIRVEAAADGLMRVMIPSGEISIEGWQEDAIEVVGKLEDQDADVTLVSNHGHAELTLTGGASTGKLELHIRVPQRSNIDIESNTANLRISGLLGMLRFESLDGNLVVDGAPRAVIARSLTGDIDIPGANIPGFAHSDHGAVRLGAGTGRSVIGRDRQTRRYAHNPRQDSKQLDRLGERLSDIISQVVDDIDIDGQIGYNGALNQLTFDASGSMNLNLDDLADLFNEVEYLLYEAQDDIGAQMAQLGAELELLGDELRRGGRER